VPGKFFSIAATACILVALQAARPTPAAEALPQQPPQQQGPAAGQPAVPASGRALRTVVIDPGHGGADSGARGASGVVEKDAVLGLAGVVAAALRHQGLAVVQTREGDENPSFDERAAIANARPGAIFLSLHIGSTGPAGTARVYYYNFSELATPNAAPPPGIVPWSEAQRPSSDLSRRLAELLQVDLAERFRDSPELPVGATVYQLRLVAEPAVAVEISSVAVADKAAIEAMGPPLAAAVAQAIASFRPVYEGAVK